MHSLLCNWNHSFSRLFTLVRTGLWKKWDLLSFLKIYGTADRHVRYCARPDQAYLQGFG